MDNAVKRPVAFMLTIGNFAMRKARAQFACNFFASGGYKVLDNIGFKTIDEGLNAAQEAHTDIIVVCSSDDEYSVFAPEVFEKAGNKSIVVIAGNPPCADYLKTKGIEYFISVRSDVTATLKVFNGLVGKGMNK
jgi:methylmalonyl-CoA mutase